MAEVISGGKVTQLVSSLKSQGKQIVLAGGCFDVLHPGHVIFLEKAKKAGDILIVMLESDRKVKLLKGLSRPVHTQRQRAQVLSAVVFVDYILMLPFMSAESEYDKLIEKISPDVIAATIGDANAHQHQRSARKTGARFKYVTAMIGNHSTSHILDHKK